MENPLQTIVQTATSLFQSLVPGKDTKSILGVDVGSSSIKVVQLKRRRGTAVLETYGELALGPYADMEVGRATNLSPEKLAEALKDIIAEANVTATSCGVSIPFSASLITVITLPKVDKGQLANMIPIEARKYIPVPISEVTLDWFVIPEEEEQYLSREEAEQSASAQEKVQVLLVAIHKETLNKYQQVLKDVGLDVSFYEIEIFSTIRAVLGQGVEPVMVIDIGAASTKVYIVEFGIVKVSHLINKGSQDITLALSRSDSTSVINAEKTKREVGLLNDTNNPQTRKTILLTLEYIFSQANRVLLNYQRKYNRSIGKVIFTGGGAVLKGLQEEAKNHFSTDVIIADPFAKTQTPAFLENVLKQVGPEFAVAVGAALRKLEELK
ncbi:MAG: type IV pilus assembly protein PilM [Candidatus Pacebacteria bacterium]|nr:type IV pilus assembly protein PilM [Candidatus Paceibacterota bacterium]